MGKPLLFRVVDAGFDSRVGLELGFVDGADDDDPDGDVVAFDPAGGTAASSPSSPGAVCDGDFGGVAAAPTRNVRLPLPASRNREPSTDQETV